MSKRKRGRPVGTTGPRQTKEAVQVLNPRHDRIVFMHLAGMKNTEIAETLNISDQTVSNILGDPKALELISESRKRIKDVLMNDIDHKIVSLAHRGLENLEKTINAEIKVSHPAKKHQDRVSIDILKVLKYENHNNGGSAQGLPVEVADRLTKALEKADLVNEIEIQDADYTVIEPQQKKVSNG